MKRYLWADCETFSECDLKTHGTPRYAEHPSTEIMIVQWAIDDGDPVVEDLTGQLFPSAELMTHLTDPEVIVVFHNSAFDRRLIAACWDIHIPPERIEDTMVAALAHGLPGALEKLGNILGLAEDEAKDKRGKALIQLFCRPQPKGRTLRRATSSTHPHEWEHFLQYSYTDVIAMRAIHRKLPRWNYAMGTPEHQLWCLDQRCNDRGICVDLDLARAAIVETARAQTTLTQRTQDATDGEVEKTTKRDQLLFHILEWYGVTLPDLKKDTLERRMADPELPEAVKLLLGIRLEASMTSTGKYKALINMTSEDGRLRNTIQFCGAQRTGRDAGRGFQPQNAMRPNMEQDEIDQGIDLIKWGCPEVLFPNTMKLIGNAVRGAIVAAPGKKLVVADLSNIEGRALAWLSGEEWKLQAFRAFDAGTGHDLYKLAYARSFDIKPERVTKDQRMVGKVQELALGYGGGVGAFVSMAAVYRMDLDVLAKSVWDTAAHEYITDANGMWKWASNKNKTLGLRQEVYVACEVLKRAWRDAHPATVKLWNSLGDAFKQATENPGTTFDAGPYLKVRRDGAWLRIRLPSGRYLCYMHPKVDASGTLSYFGVSPYTRQWGRITTYGPKCVENVDQAFSRDVFKSSAHRIEAAGYLPVLPVHDEWLTETPDTDEYSADALAAMMATVPAWAQGLPLAAEGFESPRYKK